MFQNIIDLNLSSNNIEDINELVNLSKVRILNLSCNKIGNICGLENMLGSLEKLVLSHNRISQLVYFKKLVING
jgi:Leucine-rich repeat (LRR) protein